MKRTTKLLLIMAIMSSPLLMRGQEIFDVSLRAGLTMAQIDGDNSGPYNKLGFQAGVSSTSYLIGPWRFLLEFNVTGKGSYVRSIGRTISLTYVEVPLLLMYRPENAHFSLAAGVAPGILAKANVSTGGEYEPSQSKNYRRFDILPLCVEASYRFNEHFALYARYDFSTINISKSRTGVYFLFPKNAGQFNRYVVGGLSYTL